MCIYEKLEKGFAILKGFLKKFWDVKEILLKRRFIGKVVKAEILHFVQDD